MTRILGIDPGSQRTGVGIIDVDEAGSSRHVFHGALALARQRHVPAAAETHLRRAVRHHRRRISRTNAAIERVFMARNPDSALKLGQARGAAICAVVSRGIVVHEYAASEVKQSVVGSGRGDKTQVQHMVGVLLSLQGPLQADAADALAIALTHAHTRASLARLGIPRTAWRRRR